MAGGSEAGRTAALSANGRPVGDQPPSQERLTLDGIGGQDANRWAGRQSVPYPLPLLIDELLR
jgi:hypothetical protein